MQGDMTDEDKKDFTINLAREVEETLNRFYDVFALRAFNCKSHRFFIKGENIASSALWVAKKRYAMAKIYDLEKMQDVDKMAVKGLDVVRSSFPAAFRDFMNELLMDILRGEPKELLDKKILDFKPSLKDKPILDIARNTSANNMTKYGDMGKEEVGMNDFKKGTPAHIKACLVYNRLLKVLGLDKQYEPIVDGDKIKYVMLKPNRYKIASLAIKGYQDPPELVQMIEEHIDTDAMFDNELRNKLDDFYSALKWGNIPTEVNQNADAFFAF